jgi:hypothetical protein
MLLLITILLCAGLIPAQESNIEKYQFMNQILKSINLYHLCLVQN